MFPFHEHPAKQRPGPALSRKQFEGGYAIVHCAQAVLKFPQTG